MSSHAYSHHSKHRLFSSGQMKVLTDSFTLNCVLEWEGDQYNAHTNNQPYKWKACNNDRDMHANYLTKFQVERRACNSTLHCSCLHTKSRCCTLMHVNLSHGIFHDVDAGVGWYPMSITPQIESFVNGHLPNASRINSIWGRRRCSGKVKSTWQ